MVFIPPVLILLNKSEWLLYNRPGNQTHLGAIKKQEIQVERIYSFVFGCFYRKWMEFAQLSYFQENKIWCCS